MVEYITTYAIDFLNFKNTYIYSFLKIKNCYVDISRFVLKLDNKTTLVETTMVT
jgi:hypothetical protein